jgi:hypothetical protein
MTDRRPIVLDRSTGRPQEIPVGDRIPTNVLASGTADATAFLRGDQAWATPAGGGGTTGMARQVALS